MAKRKMPKIGRPPEDAQNAINAVPKPSIGKIYTFYSFKGGVGRSMTMANIATLIASEGRKVLIVDWDLEAPGLEHYFLKHDTGLADRMSESRGVIDLLTPDAEGQVADWRDCVTQIKMQDVGLDFIQSGKQTRPAEVYTQQVQALDWQALYDQHDLGRKFDQIRQEWLQEYDFVFLDSRTGVTDIGDLCTVLLPDHLVLMFVTNTQNVQGIKDIYARVQAAHATLPTDRLALTALPLLSRDEFYSEHAASTKWRREAAEELEEIYQAWLPETVRPQEAIQKLFVPYYAIWSFGEALPVMDDPAAIDNPSSINAAFSRISRLIQSDLDWKSLDSLNVPDAGGAAIKARAELEAERARLNTEFQKNRTRRTAWTAMTLATVVFAIGASIYAYVQNGQLQDRVIATEDRATALEKQLGETTAQLRQKTLEVDVLSKNLRDSRDEATKAAARILALEQAVSNSLRALDTANGALKTISKVASGLGSLGQGIRAQIDESSRSLDQVRKQLNNLK